MRQKESSHFFKRQFLTLLLAFCVLAPTASFASAEYTDQELDTLVSTIALYPDPLLVHVLTASTYGDQIPQANDWAQSHKNLSGEALAESMEQANLPYDPSVQALIPFPTVLETMAKYKAWCDQLGDAVAMQKEQVMAAVQRMRETAYGNGHLKSDDQVKVTKGSTIVIEPTRTEYVYVPVYNPHVVYYVHAGPYPALRYHSVVWLGNWYGEWGWYSSWFDWDARFMYVRDHRWYHHRPIPHHPHRYNPPRRNHRVIQSDRTSRTSPTHVTVPAKKAAVLNTSRSDIRAQAAANSSERTFIKSSEPTKIGDSSVKTEHRMPTREQVRRAEPAPVYYPPEEDDESRGNVGNVNRSTTRSTNVNRSVERVERQKVNDDNFGRQGNSGRGGFSRAKRR
ncbi:MAG: DUF3300 domain-containing protein [Fibrobacter sp.]|nr:DUF3300 domain-containing protein [Fibrobacter sp.]